MSKRFALYILSLLSGGVLVVTSQAFTGGALEWTGFGVSAGVTAFGLIGLGVSRRLRNVAGFATLTLAGAWSLIAALIFTGATRDWLIFADGLGIAALAVIALAVHEYSTERVVHTLEVGHSADGYARTGTTRVAEHV